MTDDLTRLMQEGCQELQPDWSTERSARVWAGLQRKRVRRAVGRTVLGLLVVSGVTAIGLEVASQRGRVGASAGSLLLADGSRALPLTGDSEVRLVERRRDLTSLRLLRGGARFEVTRHPERIFRVLAEPLEVEVLGTTFEVERATAFVRVKVIDGVVAVHAPGHDRQLQAGDEERFAIDEELDRTAAAPPAGVDTLADGANEELEDDAPADERQSTRPRRSRPWRALVRAGRFDEAYAALHDGGEADLRSAQALMQAADAARLSGHTVEATGYLRRVIRQYRRDPLASLAAFTLGRVQLEQLGDPGQAARAFAEARMLAPKGSLAEDALAREVEAWAKAGDATRAQLRAELYLRRYPAGGRRQAVEQFGGVP